MAYNPAVRLISETGSPYGVRQINGKPMVLSVPYYADIAKGSIPNHYADNMLGFNPDIDNVLEDIWELGGSYVFPVSAQQMRLVSTSPADSLAGTGIQRILIHYLDNNLNNQIEIVNMNGTTPVNTAAVNILRVNKIYAAQVGSAGVAVGNISIQNIAGTITFEYLSAGLNISRSAKFTTPAGYNGFITTMVFAASSTGGNPVTFFLRIKQQAEAVYNFFIVHGMYLVRDSTVSIETQIPIKVLPNTDVIVSGISTAINANTQCIASIRGWFEPV